jgi:hypothetical protein
VSLLTALACLLAAVLAVGVGALIQALIPTIPGWLLDIIRLFILLLAFVWLGTVLK